MYLHQLHKYSWNGYYFLTDDQGAVLSPENIELSSDPATHTVTDYDYLSYLEEETYNLINSGKEWYGDNFNVNLEENYAFDLPGNVEGEPVKLRISAAARSSVTSSFTVFFNNDWAGSIENPGTDLSSYVSTYAYETGKVFSYIPEADFLTLTMEYDRPDANSQGWLNSISLNGRSRLSLDGPELLFRDSRSTGFGNVSEFRLENCSGNTVLWDITRS